MYANLVKKQQQKTKQNNNNNKTKNNNNNNNNNKKQLRLRVHDMSHRQVFVQQWPCKAGRHQSLISSSSSPNDISMQIWKES